VGLAAVGLGWWLARIGVMPIEKVVHVQPASNPSPPPATRQNTPSPPDALEIPRPQGPPSPPRPPARPALPAPPSPFGDNPPQEIAGIGAALNMKGGELVIMSVLPGSPAERAGLPPGWLVDKVDGTSTRDRPLVECVQLIRGPVGTKIKLDLIDPQTNERKTYEVIRERIQLNR
jgi:hypothetical protein